MSTGTVQNSTRDEIALNPSEELAKQWCDDCRAALGKAPIDRTKMKSATNGISNKLEELKALALAMPAYKKQLDDHRTKFMKIAFDLHNLEATINELVQSKKGNKDQKKNISANIKKYRKEILEKSAELSQLETAIRATVNSADEEQDKLTKSMKPGVLKQRKEFFKQLAVLERVADYFQTNFDPTLPSGPSQSFETYKQLDWSTIKDEKSAEDKVKAIQGDLATFKKTREEYVVYKEKYLKALPRAQLLTQQAVSLLPPNKLVTYVTAFNEAEAAAQKKRWPDTQKVSETNNDQLFQELEKAKLAFDGWLQTKKEITAALKNLEQLAVSGYKLVGQALLAKIVDLGDEKRDYATAKLEFDKLKVTLTVNIPQSSTTYNDENQRLQPLVEKATSTFANLEGIAKEQAQPLYDQLKASEKECYTELIANCIGKQQVPDDGVIKQKFKTAIELATKLGEQIQALTDPAETEKLKAEWIKEGKLEPIIKEMEQLISKTTLTYENYVASKQLPSPVPPEVVTWKANIDAAETWTSKVREDFQAKASVDLKDMATHKTNLNKVITDIETALITIDGEISSAQQELARLVAELKKALSKARAKTLREATWLTAAREELLELTTATKAQNLGILSEKKDRCIELTKQAGLVANSQPIDRIYDDTILKNYADLKNRLQVPLKKFNSKAVRLLIPRQTERFAGKAGSIVRMLAELRNDGPGAMPAKMADWTNRIDELQKEFAPVLSAVDELKKERDLCVTKIGLVRGRIAEDLCVAIKIATKKTVLGSSLKFTEQLQIIQGNMATAETIAAFKQIYKELSHLDEQLQWAIDEVNVAPPKGEQNAAKFLEEHDTAEKAASKKHDEQAKLKVRFHNDEKGFATAREKVTSTKGFDKREVKRYVDFYKQALKALDMGNLDEAVKKMNLCRRLMETLASDPLGSKTTARGNEHLKELNLRWVAAIERTNKAAEGLQAGIVKDFEAEVGSRFEQKVTKVVKQSLKGDAFVSDLLILQGPKPKSKAEQEKDLLLKRKHRERALATMRTYKNLVQNHPIFRGILFAKNPWNANLNGLGLMRAVNDIDLNVSRAVD